MNKYLCATVMMALALGASYSKASEPIKIGYVTAMTGPGAPWGISEHMALKQEVKKINASGGLIGRQVQLIAYDHKGDQVEGVNSTKRLIGDGVVGIFGPSMSGVAIAMTPVVEAAGIPLFVTGATNPKVTYNFDTKQPYRTVFRACFIDTFQGPVAARFAISDLKAKTCAVIFDVGSDYSQGLEQYYREAFEKFGGKIVAREGYRSGEIDFRAILGKIKSTKPDVIYLPTDYTQAAMIIKQSRDLGIKTQFLGCDSCSAIEVVSLAGRSSEGFHFTNLANNEDPKLQSWIADYKKEYGTPPLLPNCVMAVDAMRMFAHAIIEAKSTEPAKIIEQLVKIKNCPVLSGILTLDPLTHNPLNRACVIETIKDGKIRFVKRMVDVYK